MKYEIGVTDGFKMGEELHWGLTLSPPFFSFSFAAVLDSLTDEVGQKSLWTIMSDLY